MSVIIVCDGNNCKKANIIMYNVSECAKKAIKAKYNIYPEHLCINCLEKMKTEVKQLSVAGSMAVIKRGAPSVQLCEDRQIIRYDANAMFAKCQSRPSLSNE